MSKIALYTIDYMPPREWLMPWRTVAEVAKYLKSQGMDVVIINGMSGNGELKTCELNGVEVVPIHHNYSELANKAKEIDTETLVIPASWRDGLKDWTAFQTLKCRKVVYFAGGVYNFFDVWKLFTSASLQYAKPYLLESLTPKRQLIKKMIANGFSFAIGHTPLTTKESAKSDKVKAITIPTGKDCFERLEEDTSILQKHGLSRQKFICYTGAPTPVRGTEILLKAIDKVTTFGFKLVMLMRKDVGSDFQRFKTSLQEMKHPDLISVITDKLTREQLKTFVSHAYGLVLPFLVVPSEIPITFLEALSCGTPIITFKNGGTTAYLQGLLIAKRSPKSLCCKMEELWKDPKLHNSLSVKATEFMKTYPTWEEIGEKWKEILSEK